MSNFLEGRREVEALGFRWRLDPGQLIDGEILAGRPWEPASTAVIERFVEPGMTVLDVGANIGYYTLLMSRIVGAEGRVISFEPMAEPREITVQHCRLNVVTNALVLPYALDDHDHEAEIFFNYSWRSQDPVVQHGNAVSFRRLDTVIKELGLERLDFIKIDVDGYEARLLRGATETLHRFHPTMILEVCDYTLRGAAGLGYLTREENDAYGAFVLRMLGELRDLGYRFLWEEDLAPVVELADTITRFDLSRRSINLVAVAP